MEHKEAAAESAAPISEHADEIEALRLRALAAFELAEAQIGVLIASLRWQTNDANVIGAARLLDERLGQARFLWSRFQNLRHEAAEAAALPSREKLN